MNKRLNRTKTASGRTIVCQFANCTRGSTFPKREKYWKTLRCPLAIDCKANNARECIERVRSEVATFCNNAPPADDQTLIAMRCL